LRRSIDAANAATFIILVRLTDFEPDNRMGGGMAEWRKAWSA